MVYILCIETSTRVCSVCISRDGEVLALAEDATDSYTHAEKLNVLVDDVIRKAELSFHEIDAFAVSEGPGSYTGLRIGVSAGKGFAFAGNKPLIAVNTLKAMTTKVQNAKVDSLFIPMIDARRMEVFCSGFTGDLDQVFKTRAEVLSDESFPEGKGYSSIYFFGDGAEKCREILEPRRFEFIPEVIASSSGMAGLAFEKFQKSEFVDTAYFEPFYLKDFVAGKPKALKK